MVSIRNSARGSAAKSIAIAVVCIAIALVLTVMLRSSGPTPPPATVVQATTSTKNSAAPTTPADQPESATKASGEIVTSSATPAAVDSPTTSALAEAAPISGDGWTLVVTDSVSGAPVVGARIQSVKTSLREIFSGIIPQLSEVGVTDAAGRFGQLKADIESGIPQGMVRFGVEADGYASQTGVLMLEPEVVAGKNREIAVTMRRAQPITGKVVDVDGAGIGAVSVVLFSSDAIRRSPAKGVASVVAFSQTVSDAVGNFTLPAAPAGEAVDLIARREGYATGGLDALTPSAEPATIVLTKADGVIFGTVKLADGTPAAGYSVTARLRVVGSQMRSLYSTKVAKTDPAGVYRLEGLATGSYSLMAAQSLDAAFGSGGSVRQQADLGTGQQMELNLVIPGDMVIKGRAVDVDTGAGVAGVRVTPGRFQNAANAATSDAMGTFTLKHSSNQGSWFNYSVEPAPGYTQVATPNGSSNHLQIPDPANPPELLIELRRGVQVRVLVVMADESTPVVGANVSTQRVSFHGQEKPATTGSDGRVTITAPVGEMFWLSAVSLDYGSVGRDMTIAPGSATEQATLVMAPWATVEGHVRDESGAGVADIQVMAGIRKAGGRMTSYASQAKTDEDGYYFIEKVQAGPILMQVNLERHPRTPDPKAPMNRFTAPEPQTIELEGGETRRAVDFLLEEGLTLDGIVVDDEANPIAGARINPQIHSASFHVNRESITDADGRFSIGGLQEDTVINWLNVNASGYVLRNGTLRDITLAASPLTITMTKLNSRAIRILYPDGTPVPRFAWRQLASDGAFVYAANSWQRVSNAEGVLDTEGLAYTHFEVIELGADGKPGMLAAAVQFGASQFANGARPEVRLAPTGAVRGVVKRDADGAPIAGAKVEGNGPNPRWSGWSNPQNAGDLQLPVAMTNAKGEFLLTHLTPRSHILRVTHDSYQQVVEESGVPIEHGREAGPVTLTMTGLGTIRGIVIGHDGKPAVGAMVTVRKNQNWNEVKSHVSDAEGRFVMENATYEGYNFEASITTPVNMSTSRYRDLSAENQTEDVVFDFSGVVKLTGKLLEGGKPYTGALYFSATRLDGDEAPQEFRSRQLLTMQGSDYSVILRPGKHKLVGRTRNSNSMTSERPITEFEVAAEPFEQKRDFEISTARVSVALVFPSDDDVVEGDVILAPEVQPGEQAFRVPHKVRTARPDVTIPEVIEGTYSATYLSLDKQWQGSSEKVRITNGAENIVVVDVFGPNDRTVIGKWDETALREQFQSFELDATAALRGANKLTVGFDYVSGNEGLQIESVALRVNGREVSRDNHLGWSGVSRRDHLYRLNAGVLPPQARVTVVVSYKASGTSSGAIWAQGGR